MENTEKPEGTAQNSGDTDQEEIIDLTEAVEPIAGDEPIIDLEDVLEVDEDDEEEIIDLLDSVDSVSEDAQGGDSEDILNLTEIVEPVSIEEDDTLPDLEEPFPMEEDLKFDRSPRDDVEIADSIGLDLEDDESLDDDEAVMEAPAGQLPVSPDQIEAALERVIEKMFGKKIESMIYDVVEKAVTREIRRIKNAIMEEPLE